MALHTELGKKGEELAADFLSSKGYVVLHRNWRHGRSEVDLIALYQKRLHFIEVKTRSTPAFGPPEQNVHPKKIGFLLRAAAAFVARHPHYHDFRIDVLSICFQPDGKPDFFLIEDVY